MTSSPSGISLQEGVNDDFSRNGPLLDPEKDQNTAPTSILMGKIIYMGLLFLLLNTASNCQNLLSQIYEQLGYDNLGTTTLLLQSFFYVVGTLTIPGIIKNWEYKRGINIGVLGNILVLVAGTMTTACGVNKNLAWCQDSLYVYGSNLIFALVYGFTGPMIWFSGIRYVSGCASKDQQGQAMGIFIALFSGSLVLGGIVSKVTITRFGSFGYYLISFGFACISMIMSMVAPQVKKAKEEDAEERIIEKTKKILKLVVGSNMRVLLPYMLYTGFISAMVAAFQYKLVQNTDSSMTPDDLNKISATMNLVQGIISIVTSVVAGKLSDMLKRRTALGLFTISQVIAVIVAYLSYREKSFVLVYATAILWGIGIFGANTVLATVIAKDFGGSLEAYAIPQVLNPLATTLGYALCLLPQMMLVLVVLAVFSLFSVICTSFYKAKEEENK